MHSSKARDQAKKGKKKGKKKREKKMANLGRPATSPGRDPDLALKSKKKKKTRKLPL